MKTKGMNTPPREEELENFSEDDVIEMIDLDDEELLEFSNDPSEDLSEEEVNGNEEGGEEVVDMATLTFDKHTGSVFCCAVSPKELVCVTGGEDDLAYVWDLKSGQIIFECTGHKDSVTQVSFSHDGGYVATGDMSGHIQVWKMSTKSMVWSFDTGDLNWLLWHSSSNVLFAGCEDGGVWMWLIPSGNTKSLPNHGISAESGALMHDGKRLVVGYSNGFLKIFDLKSCSQLHTISDSLSHIQSISHIATHKDNNIILTGSLDGTAKLFNSNSGKLITTLNCDVKPTGDIDDADQHTDASVEVVSFCPTLPNIAVTATLSGIISIWDISSQSIRHSIIQGCGTSSIIWHPHKAIFYATCLDGCLRIYDTLTAELLSELTGHSKSILAGALAQGGSTILTTSDDRSAKVFTQIDQDLQPGAAVAS